MGGFIRCMTPHDFMGTLKLLSFVDVLKEGTRAGFVPLSEKDTVSVDGGALVYDDMHPAAFFDNGVKCAALSSDVDEIHYELVLAGDAGNMVCSQTYSDYLHEFGMSAHAVWNALAPDSAKMRYGTWQVEFLFAGCEEKVVIWNGDMYFNDCGARITL